MHAEFSICVMKRPSICRTARSVLKSNLCLSIVVFRTAVSLQARSCVCNLHSNVFLYDFVSRGRKLEFPPRHQTFFCSYNKSNASEILWTGPPPKSLPSITTRSGTIDVV